MLHGELIPLCLDYFFFFARNPTDKKQNPPQILSKDFPCVKTIPNV